MTEAGEPAAALDRPVVRALAERALIEDSAWHDLTTAATVPPEQEGRAAIRARASGVICGLAFGEAVYGLLDARVQWLPAVEDGAAVEAGTCVAELRGPLGTILRGERVTLNFLQRLSGIATTTRVAVERVAHTPARILDTRKTTPGLRAAERYAVRTGGGINHRDNLGAGILIKDTHIGAVRARGQSLGAAVRAALTAAGPATGVEVEVRSIEELREALEAGARAVLLDNMPVETLREAAGVAHAAGAVAEASGGITPANLAAIAETGVDFISMGALTHSAAALDLAMEVVAE